MRPRIGITTDIDGEFVRLRHDYVTAVIDAGGIPLLLPPPAGKFGRGEVIPCRAALIEGFVHDIDGLLIPGGGDLLPEYYGEHVAVPPGCLTGVDGVRSDFEIHLVTEVMKHGKPVLGVCYGMQLLNVTFRGTLYQDLEFQGGTRRSHRGADHGVTLSGAFAAMLDLDGVSFPVNSTHHQGVKDLGDGFEVCALSEDGVIEAIRHEGRPFVVGVQWHPERCAESPLSSSLFGAFVAAARASREGRRSKAGAGHAE